MFIGLQNDFGGFDPKFSGVSMKFQEAEAYKLFWKINGMDRDPETVVKIGNEALESNDSNTAFTTFSIGTTLLHELRHFHDSLLTPFGNHIFRLRLNATVNGLQVGEKASDNRKFIVVPFSRWKGSSEERIEKVIQGTGLLIDDKKLINFPILGDNLSVAYDQVYKAYEAMNNLVYTNATEDMSYSIQPFHIFEASAILVQAQNVYTVFGEKQFELFYQQVLSDTNLSNYSIVLNLLDSLFIRKNWPINQKIRSTIISWCLFGDYESDGWDACPVNRFLKLFAHLARSNEPPTPGNAIEVFSYWDQLFNLTPVMDSLLKVSDTNKKVFNQLLKVNENVQIYEDLLSIFDARIKARDYMMDLLSSDMNSYVYPYEYQEKAEQWVSAPIKIQFQGIGLDANQPNIKSFFDIRRSIKTNNNAELIEDAVLKQQTTGIEFFDTELVTKVNDMFLMTDYYFRTSYRDEKDFDFVRESIRKSGVEPVELLW